MDERAEHPADCNACGTISEGTLRLEDLIPRFAATLKTLLESATADGAAESPRRARRRKLTEADVAEIEQRFDVPGYFDSEDAAEDLDWLQDQLNEYAPDGHWFGAHPGDAADFGFWPPELLE
jgi:hypothetical protein